MTVAVADLPAMTVVVLTLSPTVAMQFLLLIFCDYLYSIAVPLKTGWTTVPFFSCS